MPPANSLFSSYDFGKKSVLLIIFVLYFLHCLISPPAVHQKIFKKIKILDKFMENLEKKVLFSIVAKVHSIAAIYCIGQYNNVRKLQISELYY